MSVGACCERGYFVSEAGEQVFPAIIVVIADAHPVLPARPRQSQSFRNASENAVAILLEPMPGGPGLSL
jgi:hypothetical protein